MKCAISIGSYDGVHLGHQSILSLLNKYSIEYSLKSVVFCFSIPPKLYLNSNISNNLITTLDERYKLIKLYGINKIEFIKFNDVIKNLSAEDFFKKYIFKKYEPRYMVVGKDFSVGHNREGNLKWLYDFAIKNSIDLRVIDFINYKGHKISSTIIRHYLHSGNIKDANICLGREYFLSGIVIKGSGVGKKIGFPTANLKIDCLKILPHGVYAVNVSLDGKKYMGVANIGRRPTLKTLNNKIICEVHILNFNKNIYGKKINVFFVEKIRDEKKFVSIDDLIKQIKKDIKLRMNITENISNISDNLNIKK